MLCSPLGGKPFSQRHISDPYKLLVQSTCPVFSVSILRSAQVPVSSHLLKLDFWVMPHGCPCSDEAEGKHDYVIVYGEGIGLIRAINSLYTHCISLQHPSRDRTNLSPAGPACCGVRPRLRHSDSWGIVWDTGDLLGHLWRTGNIRAQSDLAEVEYMLYSCSGPQHALCAGPHWNFLWWRSTSLSQGSNPDTDQCVIAQHVGWSSKPTSCPAMGDLYQHLGCCERGQHPQLPLWQNPAERRLD